MTEFIFGALFVLSVLLFIASGFFLWLIKTTIVEAVGKHLQECTKNGIISRDQALAIIDAFSKKERT